MAQKSNPIVSSQVTENARSSQFTTPYRSKVPILKKAAASASVPQTPSESDHCSTATTTTIVTKGPLKSCYEKDRCLNSRISTVVMLDGSPIVLQCPRGVRMTRTATMRLERSHLRLNGWGKWKTGKPATNRSLSGYSGSKSFIDASDGNRMNIGRRK